MAQKSMTVQNAWRRWLIGIGTPVGVMANVGDRKVIRCYTVWLIGPLIQGIRIVASGRHIYAAFRFDQGLHRHSLSADRAIKQGQVRYGQELFGGLPEENCVRSRAETRASIAQNPTRGNEGARDRVVTGLHLGLP